MGARGLQVVQVCASLGLQGYQVSVGLGLPCAQGSGEVRPVGGSWQVRA